jgi:hypothetical protein
LATTPQDEKPSSAPSAHKFRKMEVKEVDFLWNSFMESSNPRPWEIRRTNTGSAVILIGHFPTEVLAVSTTLLRQRYHEYSDIWFNDQLQPIAWIHNRTQRVCFCNGSHIDEKLNAPAIFEPSGAMFAILDRQDSSRLSLTTTPTVALLRTQLRVLALYTDQQNIFIFGQDISSFDSTSPLLFEQYVRLQEGGYKKQQSFEIEILLGIWGIGIKRRLQVVDLDVVTQTVILRDSTYDFYRGQFFAFDLRKRRAIWDTPSTLDGLFLSPTGDNAISRALSGITE